MWQAKAVNAGISVEGLGLTENEAIANLMHQLADYAGEDFTYADGQAVSENACFNVSTLAFD